MPLDDTSFFHAIPSMGELTMTDKIKLEVTEEQADKLVEQMEEELERIENTLNSFRSNSLTDTSAYVDLQNKKDEVEENIADVSKQIDNQIDDGLGNLFG